jgi:hypothetical protein
LALVVKSTKDLIKPGQFYWKVLVYGLPGTGKSKWASGAPNPGIIACETGHGKGLLTLADETIDYVEPSSLSDFESVTSGTVFKDKDTLVFDSLSYFVKTVVKDEALRMPRKFGDSPKRKAGVPELDDYGVMGELTRKYVEKLLMLPKNVVVLATEKYSGGNEDNPELVIGPDLPGAMFLGSTAMFDAVLRLRTRPKLRDPKDAKSKYTERYFVTQPDGAGTIAKCRSTLNGRAILDREEIFDLETGQGSFQSLYDKILKAYNKE